MAHETRPSFTQHAPRSDRATTTDPSPSSRKLPGPQGCRTPKLPRPSNQRAQPSNSAGKPTDMNRPPGVSPQGSGPVTSPRSETRARACSRFGNTTVGWTVGVPHRRLSRGAALPRSSDEQPGVQRRVLCSSCRPQPRTRPCKARQVFALALVSVGARRRRTAEIVPDRQPFMTALPSTGKTAGTQPRIKRGTP
jgi:hypothetical protein